MKLQQQVLMSQHPTQGGYTGATGPTGRKGANPKDL